MFYGGIAVLIVGFAILILPLVGIPISFLSSLGKNREIAGIIIAVIGGVVAFMGMRHDD